MVSKARREGKRMALNSQSNVGIADHIQAEGLGEVCWLVFVCAGLLEVAHRAQVAHQTSCGNRSTTFVYLHKCLLNAHREVEGRLQAARQAHQPSVICRHSEP